MVKIWKKGLKNENRNWRNSFLPRKYKRGINSYRIDLQSSLSGLLTGQLYYRYLGWGFESTNFLANSFTGTGPGNWELYSTSTWYSYSTGTYLYSVHVFIYDTTYIGTRSLVTLVHLNAFWRIDSLHSSLAGSMDSRRFAPPLLCSSLLHLN